MLRSVLVGVASAVGLVTGSYVFWLAVWSLLMPKPDRLPNTLEVITGFHVMALFVVTFILVDTALLKRKLQKV